MNEDETETRRQQQEREKENNDDNSDNNDNKNDTIVVTNDEETETKKPQDGEKETNNHIHVCVHDSEKKGTIDETAVSKKTTKPGASVPPHTIPVVGPVTWQAVVAAAYVVHSEGRYPFNVQRYERKLRAKLAKKKKRTSSSSSSSSSSESIFDSSSLSSSPPPLPSSSFPFAPCIAPLYQEIQLEKQRLTANLSPSLAPPPSTALRIPLSSSSSFPTSFNFSSSLSPSSSSSFSPSALPSIFSNNEHGSLHSSSSDLQLLPPPSSSSSSSFLASSIPANTMTTIPSLSSSSLSPSSLSPSSLSPSSLSSSSLSSSSLSSSSLSLSSSEQDTKTPFWKQLRPDIKNALTALGLPTTNFRKLKYGMRREEMALRVAKIFSIAVDDSQYREKVAKVVTSLAAAPRSQPPAARRRGCKKVWQQWRDETYVMYDPSLPSHPRPKADVINFKTTKRKYYSSSSSSSLSEQLKPPKKKRQKEKAATKQVDDEGEEKQSVEDIPEKKNRKKKKKKQSVVLGDQKKAIFYTPFFGHEVKVFSAPLTQRVVFHVGDLAKKCGRSSEEIQTFFKKRKHEKGVHHANVSVDGEILSPPFFATLEKCLACEKQLPSILMDIL